jgi:endonuclease YncB( thermonuclease family)
VLNIFRHICDGSSRFSFKVFEASNATFFKPKNRVKIMASLRHKTSVTLRPILPISAVIFFILLLHPVLYEAGQFKVIRVIDGDTIKVTNNGKTIIIRLVGIDSPETSKGKNQHGQPFSRKSTQHLSGLVLKKPVEIQSYGTDRYGRTLGVIYCNGTNVNLEIVKAGLAADTILSLG